MQLDRGLIRRYCGPYIYRIDGNNICEYCGKALYTIDGEPNREQLLALITLLFIIGI